MIVERAELEKLTKIQLQAMAAQSGEAPKQSDSKEDLITRIIYASAKQSATVDQEDEAKNQSAEDEDDFELDEETDAYINPNQVECTIEEVKKAVNRHILVGMKVFHDKDEGTWLFHFDQPDSMIQNNITGRYERQPLFLQDSGTLKQPLGAIKRSAATMMAKARFSKAEEKKKVVSDRYTSVA